MPLNEPALPASRYRNWLGGVRFEVLCRACLKLNSMRVLTARLALPNAPSRPNSPLAGPARLRSDVLRPEPETVRLPRRMAGTRTCRTVAILRTR